LKQSKYIFFSLFFQFDNGILKLNMDFLLCMFLFIAGTDDEQQEYDYLGAWGPRFDKLANMYGPEAPNPHNTELEL